ncbi:halocyanin domain-containing protein [Halorussus marinus]|uniref:halocyanin domain-containing protein n=1 Tax=Halorussus marinus TaxID=2505976 RepID=UPI0010929895|nr:halocyanin domain-containing protein [Halorussus marinus]
MERDTFDRRTVLKMTAAGATATALAGCSSDSGSGGGGGDETESDGSGDESGDGGSDSYEFDGWFDDTSNFDGVVDETGSDEVTVEVGVDANGGAFGFGPAAVAVSPGTTVVWEWTGKGSFHNVVAENGDFESEQTDEEGFTFEHTFESAGTYKYICSPHETMGMVGAIVVE